MKELTAFQRDIMFVVAGHDEPHGLAIKEELDEYYEDEINHGRLYPNLDTLVTEGYLDKGEKDRRTNFYNLTDQGEEAIEARRQFQDDLVEEDEDAEEALI